MTEENTAGIAVDLAHPMTAGAAAHHHDGVSRSSEEDVAALATMITIETRTSAAHKALRGMMQVTANCLHLPRTVTNAIIRLCRPPLRLIRTRLLPTSLLSLHNFRGTFSLSFLLTSLLDRCLWARSLGSLLPNFQVRLLDSSNHRYQDTFPISILGIFLRRLSHLLSLQQDLHCHMGSRTLFRSQTPYHLWVALASPPNKAETVVLASNRAMEASTRVGFRVAIMVEVAPMVAVISGAAAGEAQVGGSPL